MTAALDLNLPDSVKLSDFDLKMTLAAKLYEDGTLSGGQAAELVGISKRSFLEQLGKYGVSVFGYTAEEVSEELKRDNLSVDDTPRDCSRTWRHRGCQWKSSPDR